MMKKISLYTASVLALGLGLVSCDQLHNDLRLDPPTDYVLETPENTDQLIIFGNTGSNVDNEWVVNTLNPYNITTQVDFQVQVARSQEDFLMWDDLVQKQIESGNDDGDYNFKNEEDLPYVVTINQIYTSPKFTMAGADFCDGINELYGFDIQTASENIVPVAYRVHAWIPGVEYSSIFSNIVQLEKVQSYVNLTDPRDIYLIGTPQGWTITDGTMKATETGIGTNIYKGTFKIAPAEQLKDGACTFRFYSELGDWEHNSIGSQEEDTPIDVELTDNKYFGDVVYGKGSWTFPDWEGGEIKVEIDLNEMTITFDVTPGWTGDDEGDTPATPTGKVIYIIGACQSGEGWNIDSDELWLQETEEGSNIYENTISIASGKFTFRIYTELGDWETNSLGSLESGEDADFDITLPYSGEIYEGKGKWHDPSWEGGYVNIVADLNEMTITMKEVDGPALPEPEPEPSDNALYLRGGMNNWEAVADYMFTEVSDTEWKLENVDIASGVEFKIANIDWQQVDLGGPGEENGVVVPIGDEFTLVSGGKNLVLDSEFSGTVTLTLSDGTYTLLLAE